MQSRNPTSPSSSPLGRAGAGGLLFTREYPDAGVAGVEGGLDRAAKGQRRNALGEPLLRSECCTASSNHSGYKMYINQLVDKILQFLIDA